MRKRHLYNYARELINDSLISPLRKELTLLTDIATGLKIHYPNYSIEDIVNNLIIFYTIDLRSDFLRLKSTSIDTLIKGVV